MKRDAYQEVTDRIVAALEAGATGDEWSPPWVSLAASGRPVNACTKRPYNGINVLMLWADQQQHGFASNRWASYRQWAKVGAQVRKGEKGSMIVFYRQIEVKDEDAEDGKRRIPLLRYSTVFNAEQVDGYDFEKPEPPSIAERAAEIDTFLDATGATFNYGGDRAFYAPLTDEITLPPVEQFHSTEGFYGTAFHELVHWSGAEQRLDRDLRNRFGDDRYAMEELIAELGSAFLAADHAIEAEPRADHAEYLAHWLKVLKGDKKAIFAAAARASDAAEYLHGGFTASTEAATVEAESNQPKVRAAA